MKSVFTNFNWFFPDFWTISGIMFRTHPFFLYKQNGKGPERDIFDNLEFWWTTAQQMDADVFPPRTIWHPLKGPRVQLVESSRLVFQDLPVIPCQFGPTKDLGPFRKWFSLRGMQTANDKSTLVGFGEVVFWDKRHTEPMVNWCMRLAGLSLAYQVVRVEVVD